MVSVSTTTIRLKLQYSRNSSSRFKNNSSSHEKTNHHYPKTTHSDDRRMFVCSFIVGSLRLFRKPKVSVFRIRNQIMSTIMLNRFVL